MRDTLLKLFRSRTAGWTLAVVAVVSVAGAGAYSMSARREPVPIPASMRYSDLLVAIAAGRVDSILIEPGTSVRGWTHGAQGTAAQLGFRVEYGSGQVEALVKSATAANIGVAFAPHGPDRTGLSTAIGVVIAAVAVGLFLFIAIGRQGGRSR
jgi:hypothetical protein